MAGAPRPGGRERRAEVAHADQARPQAAVDVTEAQMDVGVDDARADPGVRPADDRQLGGHR